MSWEYVLKNCVLLEGSIKKVWRLFIENRETIEVPIEEKMGLGLFWRKMA